MIIQKLFVMSDCANNISNFVFIIHKLWFVNFEWLLMTNYESRQWNIRLTNLILMNYRYSQTIINH